MTGHAAFGRAGFTMTEAMIASAISSVVAAGVITVFIWCFQQAQLCSKVAWSENQAMDSSEKLTTYIRNASAVTNMDVSQGRWIDLKMPDGTIGRLVYSNGVTQLRDGRLYLQRPNGGKMIVARGMTEIMDSQGFTQPVFARINDHCVRVTYRVSEPVAGGGRETDDENFAACVRFSVALRNAPQ